MGPDRRGIQVANLTEAYRLRNELQQINDSLMEIEVGSQANLESYKEVMAEIAELDDRIAKHNQRKGVLQDKLSELAEEQRKLAEQQKSLQESRGRGGPSVF